MVDAQIQPVDQPASDPAGCLPLDRPEPLSLTWSHPPGLVGLSAKNFALRIVTFGIYNFWGKTEVRQRIWSAARLNDEPLQYTGTGRELMVGFLIVFGFVVFPSFLISMTATLALGPQSRLLYVVNTALSAGYFVLIGIGIHRAQRYRLSRTQWRGIRGGLDGNALAYAWAHVWTGIVAIVTLGWAVPWRSTLLQGLISNQMRFGDRPFRFDATSGPLYGRFAVLWFSSVVIALIVVATLGALQIALLSRPDIVGPGGRPDMSTVLVLVAVLYGTLIVGALLYGVVSAWYRAGVMNHFAAHTTFEGARFKGSATGAGLVWIMVSNWAMVLLTLGLLTPVAMARAARYQAEHLSIEGGVPLAAILQRAQDDTARGEGLAQAFDVDAF